jgi:TonB family protein
MRKQPNKIFWWVFGVHASALFLILVIPLLKGCFHRKPKEVIVETMIVSEAPSTVATPQPTPQPAPQPKPQPAPQPEPAPKKPAPAPEKPKWKPAEVIRQDKRITRPTTQTPTPQPTPQPKPDLSQLKNALNSAASTANADDLYYSAIRPRFYAIWQPPAGTPYGTKATVTIRVSANGTILYRALTSPSGNPAFDQSVNAALGAVSRLPAPPDSLINRDIFIYFQPR